MTTLVWLKNDLRLEDNPAMSAALSQGSPEEIAVLFGEAAKSPGHVRPTARRTAHEGMRWKEMKAVLHRSGIRTVDAEPEHDVVRVAASMDATRVLANAETSDDLGFTYDRAVARELRSCGIDFVELPVDGVSRGSGSAPAPLVTGARDLARLRFEGVPPALADLRRYLDRLPDAHYRRDMWTPGPDAAASSRLSIDLACGALSGDRVLHEIGEKAERSHPRTHDAYRQFAARIGWRRSFVQMLEDNVAAFPWGRMRSVRPDDDATMAAWRAGETGYPLVDAAMKTLDRDGWINFRLRQVVCSFAIDLLDLDLHLVGVALGEMFDDYSPGIHWPQIGLQAGMAKGRGPRVINPVKQARELDPTGSYVRSVLPALRDVSDVWIHEPWRHPDHKGIRPIVDLVKASKAARLRHPAPARG